ncbi:hypothetical protein ACIQXA_26100 [Streptomyces massasporeus]|uniref:hypothetical protein n=1 Tax=Streptomyces massasporeus TaxID=67324 RepID=UPI0038006880
MLILGGGYIWYQMGDTGKGWRYKEKLATYCEGLIPYDESDVFTGLTTEIGLTPDEHRRFGDGRFYSCRVSDMTMTIGLITDDAVNSGQGEFETLDTLRSSASDTPQAPRWRLARLYRSTQYRCCSTLQEQARIRRRIHRRG